MSVPLRSGRSSTPPEPAVAENRVRLEVARLGPEEVGRLQDPALRVRPGVGRGRQGPRATAERCHVWVPPWEELLQLLLIEKKSVVSNWIRLAKFLHNRPLEVCLSMAVSMEQAAKDYADFMDKVKRTIYLDQLSPQVTSQVIKSALSQCANVINVEFIVNYTIPYDIPSAALVELDDELQAKAAVELMNDFPFIIGGMPRPVKATSANPEMFRDRPRHPGINKESCWVKQGDSEYETVKKLKNLAKRQETENMALIKNQLEEEKELAKQQQEVLDGNCKKYGMLETVMKNGAIKKLAHLYGVNLDDY